MALDCAFSANRCTDDPHCCASTTFTHERYRSGERHRELTVQCLASALNAQPVDPRYLTVPQAALPKLATDGG